MPTKLVAVVTTALLLSGAGLSFVHAHEGGHGAALSGKGPGGGRLAPVVLARHAELGAKAETQAVAEWWVKGSALSVKLWDKERKAPLAVAGDIKWILLGKKLGKPVVQVEKLPAGKEIRRDLGAELKKLDAVELILPNLGESAEKHVVAIGLK